MKGRFILSLLFICQGLLFISAVYAQEEPEEPGVKVEETDWVDISADLADVDDDNTHQDNSQQEGDEETPILSLEEPGDDDDNDDDSDGGVMELDDDESNSKDIPADDFALKTQSKDASENRFCLPLTVPILNTAVCRVGIPLLQRYANNARIPNFRRGRVRVYGIDISGTNVGSCSVTGGRSTKTLSISNMRTQVFARYRYKRGWFRIRGRIYVRVTGVSLRLSFNHVPGTGCRQTLSNLSCSSSIRRVRVRVRGGLVGRIINLFRGRIGRILRGNLNRQICRATTKFIRNRASRFFRSSSPSAPSC